MEVITPTHPRTYTHIHAHTCTYKHTHMHAYAYTHTHTYTCAHTCESVKVLVAQLCLTLCDPMDCSLPGFSVHEILQARILEWVAIPFPRGSSEPRGWTRVSRIAGRFFTIWAIREAQTRIYTHTYTYTYTHTCTHSITHYISCVIMHVIYAL